MEATNEESYEEMMGRLQSALEDSLDRIKELRASDEAINRIGGKQNMLARPLTDMMIKYRKMVLSTTHSGLSCDTALTLFNDKIREFAAASKDILHTMRSQDRRYEVRFLLYGLSVRCF